MALNKTDLMTLYNLVYDPDSSQDVTWDGAGQRRDGRKTQILAVLLNILQSVDPSFAPPGGGTQAGSLTEYTSADGAVTLPTGTYVEVSIYATSGSAGTIFSAPVIAGNNYVYRADSGKTLDDIDFEATAGTFQVLTVAA